MSGSEQLRKSLKRMMRDQLVHAAITGTVKAVNESEYTCDVEPSDGGAILYDVRLKVSRGGQDTGSFSIPKVGSKVLALVIDGNENNLAIVQVEDVEEHVVRVNGNAELRVKPSGTISINGEEYGGLVKVNELRTELAKVNAFLTTLRTAIQSAPVVANDGGASFKASLSAAIASLQLPTYSGIESQKTKHGSL